MKLINKNSQQMICKNLMIANNFYNRALGLMFKKHLSEQACLWIKNCNSIHTHFMRFPIDIIYLDQSLKVLKLKENVKPWRFTLPVLGADSVIELCAQNIREKIKEGDQVYVDA